MDAEAEYFARVRPGDSISDYSALLRRVRSGAGFAEEILGRDGLWRSTVLLGAVERGEASGLLRRLSPEIAEGFAASDRDEYALVQRALARQRVGEFPLRLVVTGDFEDEEPLEAEVRAEAAAFLTGAAVVGEGPEGVYRTDGMWVWPEAIASTVLATGRMPAGMFHPHVQARQYFYPAELGPGVLERAQRLLEVARTAPSDVPVREESVPGRPPEPTRAERMTALSSWHSEWVGRHESSTPFRPRDNTEVEDYNLHHVDLEASAEAQREYDRRAREIMGLDPETGRSVDF